MKRWKLWATVVPSIMSAVSIPTYYFWPRSAGSEVAEVSATKSEDASPHAEPPKPITDSSPRFNDQPQFVSPASFNAPASGQEDSRQSDRYSPASQSQFDSAPRTVPPVPLSGYGSNSPSPRYRTSLSDASEPASDSSVADSASAATVAFDPSSSDPQSPAPQPVEPLSSDPQSSDPQPVEPQTIGPESIDDQSSATAPPEPVDAEVSSALETSPATSTVTLPASEPAQPTVEPLSPKAPAVLTPPKSKLRQPAELGSSPAEDSQSRGPGAELNPTPPSTFGNPSRPTAPSLRTNMQRDTGLRTGLPPATLSETTADSPVAPAPGRLSELPPTSADSRASRLISGSPGERKLEGVQAPSLTIERSAPEEIQIGKPAKFVIRVRNVGQVPAQGVVVSDQVPQGTRLLSASPEITTNVNGAVTWELGALLPGNDTTLTLELMPEAEGEIGSVAEVTFRAQAAVRTISTKPMLKIEHSGPTKVLIGEEVPFQISVSNPGTGITTGVVVEVDVPEGLEHDGGREIMSDRFDLRPNESRKIDLILKAVQAGNIQSVVRAVADSNLKSEHSTPVEVVAPQLQIAIAGATRRFLDRPVKYQIGISNPGTAPAQQIELIARLPRGLKFVSADKKGAYDQRQHAVLWSLEELPAGEQGVVELTAIPTDTGEQKLHVEGQGALSIEDRQEHTTVVEDITDLVFTVTDENVPIEVGSDTTYQIRVANNGTKVARNIRLAVQLPDGLQIIDSDGPTQIQRQGDQLLMQPIAQLAQQEEAVYRVAVKGTRAGDHVLRVQLLSDEFSAPVTKEEITKVYSDK